MKGSLAAVALVGAAVLVAALVVKQPAAQSQGGCDYGIAEAFAIQGIHHNLGLVQTNAAGEQLTVDDVVVATDRIAVDYHATGVNGISMSQFAQDPRYRSEPDTLVHLVADGQTLVPIDGSIGGEQNIPTRWGQFVGRWAGGTPRHLHISVERLEGDLQAKWEVDADLGVQGDHQHAYRDLGSTNGRHLVIDDVVVGTNRIGVVYHATGIRAVHTGGNPIFVQEGATLMTATSNGESLVRYEDSELCQAGTSTVRGEMVFAWRGGTVHRLQISVFSMAGDDHTTWGTTFAF